VRALQPEDRKKARPVAIYMDGTQYTKRDSFWDIFVQNMQSGRRHLYAIVRKEDLCKCGCKGWCTMFCLLFCLVWSLTLGATGRFAEDRHDSTAFRPGEDAWRIAQGGVAMGIFLVTCEMRADWPAFNWPLGFRAWNHLTAPCPFCTSPLTDLYLMLIGRQGPPRGRRGAAEAPLSADYYYY